MKELHELKEQLVDDLKGYRGKTKKSIDDITVIKYLSSAIDHIGNIIKNVDDEEYSGNYPWSYNDRSYARRRDSMGRYSRDGYSRSDLTDKLRDLMGDAPDDRTRMEIKRLIEKMD